MSFLDKLPSKPRAYKDPVRAATIGTLPTNTRQGLYLVATVNGALPSIDAIAVVVGDRILVWLEADATKNGVYDVISLGSGSSVWQLKRSTDSDTTEDISESMLVPILDGATNASGWGMLQTRSPVLGVTPLVFVVGGAVGGGGGGGFHPNDLTSLKLMLQSHLGITQAGGIVSAWADTQSGGATFFEDTDPDDPTLEAAQLNGQPSVRFAAHHLLGPAMSNYITVTEYTTFVVGRWNTVAGDAPSLAYANESMIRDGAGYFSSSCRATGPTMQAYNYDVGADVAVSASTVNTAVYGLAQTRHEGGLIYARWANQVEGTGVASGNTDAAVLVAPLWIGFGAMDVVCVLIFDEALTSGEITSVRTWVNSTYGVAV